MTGKCKQNWQCNKDASTRKKDSFLVSSRHWGSCISHPFYYLIFWLSWCCLHYCFIRVLSLLMAYFEHINSYLEGCKSKKGEHEADRYKWENNVRSWTNSSLSACTTIARDKGVKDPLQPIVIVDMPPDLLILKFDIQLFNLWTCIISVLLCLSCLRLSCS